jgi:hypothetical protein
VLLFTLQESTVIHTQLVLQPLLLHKLQGVLRQLLLQQSSSSSAGNSSTGAALAAAAAALKGRKRLTVKRPSKAKQQDQKQIAGMEDLLGSALVNTVNNPQALLTLPVPPVASCNIDVERLLGGSCFKSVKALFSGDVAQAAKALSSLCSQKVSQQLMTGEAPSDSAAAAAAAEEVHSDDLQSCSADFEQVPAPPGLLWPPPPPPPPGLHPAQPPPPGVQPAQPPPPPAAEAEAAAAATEEEEDPAPELSPVQLSGLLCDLLDMWHDVLSQHTHAHQVQQQREQLQQELEASMLQLGRDPTEAHAEASSTAEKLALQMCEQGDARDEGRWWRQQELPAVFGSSSEEAAAQLDVVAQAAGEFVERLAGGQQQEDTWHVQHTL